MVVAEIERSAGVEKWVAGERLKFDEYDVLVNGDHLTLDEFLRRWENMPGVRFAELIGGRVYLPSPMSAIHGRFVAFVCAWFGQYCAKVTFTDSGSSSTWKMIPDSPQPDAYVRLKDHPGGMSRQDGKYLRGAPELAIEISLTTAAYDLHEKMEVYGKAGVKEYLIVLLKEREVRWLRLNDGVFEPMSLHADGMFHSVEFSGLWLDPVALLAENLDRVLETAKLGMATHEFLEFAAQKLPV